MGNTTSIPCGRPPTSLNCRPCRLRRSPRLNVPRLTWTLLSNAEVIGDLALVPVGCLHDLERSIFRPCDGTFGPVSDHALSLSAQRQPTHLPWSDPLSDDS